MFALSLQIKFVASVKKLVIVLLDIRNMIGISTKKLVFYKLFLSKIKTQKTISSFRRTF